MKIWRLCVGMLVIGLLTQTAGAFPLARVTAMIVDEEGAPVEGARVEVFFTMPRERGLGLSADTVSGHSDLAGTFSASGEAYTYSESVSIRAWKIGYYPGGGYVTLERVDVDANRWEPWDQTVTIVLQSVRNPVPMYHKDTDWMKIPALDMPIGYDLERGDWVEPYGKGKVGDFIFTMTYRFASQTDAEASYTLSFLNPDDGIQEFVSPEGEPTKFHRSLSAPLEGYQTTLEKEVSYLPGQGHHTTVKDDVNYIYRVRSVRDAEGHIISAMYGKIQGDIKISRRGSVKFRYWLNPDGTPNLEAEQGVNLFHVSH